MADFGEYKIVKTKKEHRCITCNRTIPKGKNANRYNGMYEGEWQNWYMCIPCDELNVCEYGEWICGEEFIDWLNESEYVDCPKCKGLEGTRRWYYHSNYEWDDKEETLCFVCELCDHEWEKFIGFDSLK